MSRPSPPPLPLPVKALVTRVRQDPTQSSIRIGIYGVISHFVARRTRDQGIRIALGLSPARVVGGVVRRGATLVVVGISIGLLAFVVFARFLSSLIYGVGATDPLAMAAAVVALLMVGVLAALVPAVRASRTDPAIVLREQ